MNVEQLHDILDNEEKKLSVSELAQVIYEMRNDALSEYNRLIEDKDHLKEAYWYFGEMNAFQICLDLLEHLKIDFEED